MCNKSELKWLEEWYRRQCNGDWEHSFGIEIETLDNPGWLISIDLKETELENLTIDYKLKENSENDWYSIKCHNSKFTAAGDPLKLEFLLKLFRDLAQIK